MRQEAIINVSSPDTYPGIYSQSQRHEIGDNDAVRKHVCK